MTEPNPDDDTICVVKNDDGAFYACRLGDPDKLVGPFPDALEAARLGGLALNGSSMIAKKPPNFSEG